MPLALMLQAVPAAFTDWVNQKVQQGLVTFAEKQ
jgi:hypothetical protein